MRVMISMDTHSHVDGPSKVHTIKRYLSDLKEEGSVNTSSVRCRELDCLRAYYYMTILHFLKERCDSGKINQGAALQEAEKKVDKDGLKGQTENDGLKDQTEKGSQSVVSVEIDGVKFRLAESGSDSKENVENAESVIDNIPSDENLKSPVKPADKVTPGNSESVNFSTVIETGSATVKLAAASSSDNHEGGETDVKLEDPFFIGAEKQPGIETEKDSDLKYQKNEKTIKPDSISQTDSLILPVLEVSKVDIVRPKEPLHSKTVSQMNMNHFSITITKLTQLSQGLLWDLQAKRYALTETLGYIHKAISQLLLSKKPKPSIADDTVGAEKSVVRHSADGSEFQTESGSSETVQTGDDKQDSLTGDNSKNTGTAEELSGASGEIGATGTTESQEHLHEHEHHESHHVCPHHNHHGHVCQTSLSLHFEHMLNIHVPHTGDMSVPEPETEPEFNTSFFEVCASCELIQKSRKILWEDEPHFHARSEGGFKDMTNIINPAKYINVPDEWYNMPVDQKYFKPYVTMAILKDEQEYVMHELKRGPDSTQVMH